MITSDGSEYVLKADMNQSRQILESYVRNLQERADFHTFASYKKAYKKEE